jgi:hypothetical protein
MVINEADIKVQNTTLADLNKSVSEYGLLVIANDGNGGLRLREA